MSSHHNSIKVEWERSLAPVVGMGALPRVSRYVEPIPHLWDSPYYDDCGPTPVEEEGWRG